MSDYLETLRAWELPNAGLPEKAWPLLLDVVEAAEPLAIFVDHPLGKALAALRKAVEEA